MLLRVQLLLLLAIVVGCDPSGDVTLLSAAALSKCSDDVQGAPLASQAQSRGDAAEAGMCIEASDGRSMRPRRVERVMVPTGRDTVRGHVMTIPTAFEAPDGAFDLVVHFHGNTEAVEESYKRAGISAVVVIINLGEGADLYERAFADPSALTRVRRRVREKLQERGVGEPRLRRMALSAWSAGYGAVLRIIDQPKHREKLDAVLLLDGMHAGYASLGEAAPQGQREVAIGDVKPFIRLAQRAVKDELLFFVTHSRIQPKNTELASVRETADVMLEHVGVERKKVSGTTKPFMLDAVKEIYAERSMLPLEAKSVAIEGQLMVVEYGGRSPLHHVAHLLQMSQIALPRLARRWK